MQAALQPLMALFLVAFAVGMVAHRLQIPYTLALVIAGLGLGFLHIEAFDQIQLTPDLLLMLLLPPLLFEASFRLDWARARRDVLIILLLAIPGVVISTAVTAGLVWVFLHGIGLQDFLWSTAFLFGAIVAPTDPVSVLSLFKTLKVDPRLYLLMEGESLLNDGVAVVLFLIVAAVAGISLGHGAPEIDTTQEAVLYGVRTLFGMAGGGVVIGAVVGIASSAATRVVDDHLVEVSLTAIVAWGSFVLAESFHASGVLACVAAGVVHGNLGARHAMSPTTRVAVTDFWEFMAFFANTLVFLLMGLELEVVRLFGVLGPVALAFLALLLARIVVVAASWAVSRANRSVESIPARWLPVFVWGGMRGSLSMVLVIGLPRDLPHRALLVDLVFGVTATTLLLQGLTMKRLLAGLGLSGGPVSNNVERAWTTRMIASRALAEIDHWIHDGRVGETEGAILRAPYVRMQESAASALDAARDGSAEPLLGEARRRLVALERDVLREAVDGGFASEEVAEEIIGEIARKRETIGEQEIQANDEHRRTQVQEGP